MDTGFIKVDRGYRKGEIMIYKKTALDSRGLLATELITRWGFVSGNPNGEDSAGRQKLEIMPPDEVVSRACAIADLAITEFEKRGWVLELPTPEITDLTGL